MSKKLLRLRKRIVLSLVVFLVGVILPIDELLKLIFFLPAYLIVGIDVIKKAAKNIRNGQVFDENFLMMIATFGAFVTGEYPEAVMVMWLYQVGELFQGYAVGKSRESISSLMEIRPEYANIMVDGKLEEVDPEDVKINDVICVKPGEKIPLDGVVIDGFSTLDTSALTGESLPRDVKVDDEVLSGCINKTGLIQVRVLKEYENSTVAKILDLVENASNKKAKTENFISKFAKYYTPVVTIAAVCLAIIPPLFFGGDWVDFIHRACSFLVISCPCALVISVPLGFFGGIGGASRDGILIKGSNYLETLSKVNEVVFDKTGTLTKGNFEVKNISANNISEDELLKIAAHIEASSNHPIATSITKAYNNEIDSTLVSDIKEVAGKGLTAKYKNELYYVGNEELLKMHNIKMDRSSDVGTIIYIANSKEYLGYIAIADTIKDDAAESIKELNKTGVKTTMLTGDNEDIAKDVATRLGLTNYYAKLLPQDKVKKVEELLNGNNTVAFVGDGINDAPVLMRADIGIAMGALGSDAAIEASDIVIMDDKLEKIAKAIKISKRTIRIVWQNIIFALGIKGLVLVLGAFGFVNMWIAVFADVGVAFIAILNSMRALKIIK